MSERAEKFLIAQGIVPGEKAAKQYGTKGMKWGVRKKRPSSSRPSTPKAGETKSKGKASPEPKKTNTLASKPKNRHMSDAELQRKLNRIRMEQELARLTAPSPKTKTFVRQTLEDSAKQATRQVATKAATALIQIALEKAAANATGGNKVFFEAMAATSKKNKKNNQNNG